MKRSCAIVFAAWFFLLLSPRLPAQHSAEQSTITGHLTDLYTGYPLFGIRADADTFHTWTNNDGYFELLLEPGEYDLHFSSYGYQDMIIEGVQLLAGEVFTLDTALDVKPLQPFNITAHYELLFQVSVMWESPGCLVSSPVEKDDGTPNDYFVWAEPGGQCAVKFNSYVYPFVLTGGELFVGDGSYPGPFLGSSFDILVYDDDGPDGMPGTVLGQTTVTVENYGWVHFDSLQIAVYEGYVYLAMLQTGQPFVSAPLGVDTDNPSYNWGYVKYQDNQWTPSPIQDFMIRPWVAYLHPDIQVIRHRIGRLTNFDPNGNPLNGTLTELSDVTGGYYLDNVSGVLGSTIAYAVKTLYSNGEYSDYAVSNILDLRFYDLSINVALSTGSEPDYGTVEITGEEGQDDRSGSTGTGSQVAFQEVQAGKYTLRAHKYGYDDLVIEHFDIDSDTTLSIVLPETRYPPGGFLVDSLSGVATWNEPEIFVLKEDFNADGFPPEGWSTESNGLGWFGTADGSGGGWDIPPHESRYACANDRLGGASNDGSWDLLITPPMDLSSQLRYVLTFDYYFDERFSHQAFLKYSHDGSNWGWLHTLDPSGEWQQASVDLGNFSGPGSPIDFQIAFHSDDFGGDGSGLAVDQVRVFPVEYLSTYTEFQLFLNGEYAGSTTDTRFLFSGLEDNTRYTAGVAAFYSSGLSDTVSFTFTYHHLPPPRNLFAIVPDSLPILSWNLPLQNTADVMARPENLAGYVLYRNDLVLDTLLDPVDTNYVDSSFNPCQIWRYEITALYDMGYLGHPGTLRESAKEGPAMVTAFYYAELDFSEDWNATLEDQCWVNLDGGWEIIENSGNPKPSVAFIPHPGETAYTHTLNSPVFLDESPLAPGNILLEYDVKLMNFHPTGLEVFTLERWDSSNQNWEVISELTNSFAGGFYSHFSKNITSYWNNFNSLRFRTFGANGDDILGWYLDNITVRRECGLPENLFSTTDLNDIRLNWSPPDDTALLTGYVVYRGIEDEAMIEIAAPADTLYTDTALPNGKYCYSVAAVYENENGSCLSGSTAETCQIISLGMKEGQNPVFTASPNPFHDFLKLSFSEGIFHRDVTLVITDLPGNHVYRATLTCLPATLTLDLKNLQRGMYLLQIRGESVNQSIKVIKI